MPSSYEEARDYGEAVLVVRVAETMARCPSCRRPGMSAVWRRLRAGQVQCWAECPSCSARMPGGCLPKGSGQLEVETRIIELAQGGRP